MSRTVMVVDDHPIVRKAVADILTARLGMCVIATAGTADEAMRALRRTSVHVAIIDLRLGDDDGLRLVRAVAGAHPQVAILVFSVHEEIPYANAAFRAGARGYVVKRAPTDVFLDAVQRVADGGLWFGTAARGTGPIDNGPLDQYAALARLTARELKVFALIGDGRTSLEIASTLGVSRKTVDTYRARIKSKLGIPNGTQLIRAAVRWAVHEQRG